MFSPRTVGGDVSGDVSGVGPLLLSHSRSPLTDSTNLRSPPLATGKERARSSPALLSPVQMPRSVLRRRPSGTADVNCTPAPSIHFAADTKRHDAYGAGSPISSCKKGASAARSPRPPHWPVAQSPWASATRPPRPADTPGSTDSSFNFDVDADFISRRSALRAKSRRTSSMRAGSRASMGQGPERTQAVQNELLALRVAYHNMCGLVFLAVVSGLLYIQGLLVARYLRSLLLAIFASQCLRRPVHILSHLLRSAGPEGEGCDPLNDSDASTASSTAAASSGSRVGGGGEMPEWAYWRWLGKAYAAYAFWTWGVGAVLAMAIVWGALVAGRFCVQALRLTPAGEQLGRAIARSRHTIARVVVVSVRASTSTATPRTALPVNTVNLVVDLSTAGVAWRRAWA
jgi:hypothetical protein